jgi:hypothetical protein
MIEPDLDFWHELWSSLSECQEFWQRSLLQEHPVSLGPYRREWLEELLSYDDEMLFRFDQTGQLPAHSSLYSHLEPLSRLLGRIPRFTQQIDLPESTKHGLSAKKVHEFLALLAVFSELNDLKAVPLIDWGGWKGHFASLLAQAGYETVYSVDCDPNLQELGQAKYGSQVRFIATEIEDSGHSLAQLESQLAQPYTSVGLHACGPLSSTLFGGDMLAPWKRP